MTTDITGVLAITKIKRQGFGQWPRLVKIGLSTHTWSIRYLTIDDMHHWSGSTLYFIKRIANLHSIVCLQGSYLGCKSWLEIQRKFISVFRFAYSVWTTSSELLPDKTPNYLTRTQILMARSLKTHGDFGRHICGLEKLNTAYLRFRRHNLVDIRE